MSNAERIAAAFHESYERLAPSKGYETRKESAVPWEQVPEANRTLMVAVAQDLLDRGVIRPTGGNMEPIPTIGRIVIFRSRTGNYSVPAIITCTIITLAPKGVEVYEASGGEQGVPPLSGAAHVHLHVLTPGIPGQRADAQDFVVEGVRRSENVGGAYQEWDVPRDPREGEQAPGTWRWPERV